MESSAKPVIKGMSPTALLPYWVHLSKYIDDMIIFSLQ